MRRQGTRRETETQVVLGRMSRWRAEPAVFVAVAAWWLELKEWWSLRPAGTEGMEQELRTFFVFLLGVLGSGPAFAATRRWCRGAKISASSATPTRRSGKGRRCICSSRRRTWRPTSIGRKASSARTVMAAIPTRPTCVQPMRRKTASARSNRRKTSWISAGVVTPTPNTCSVFSPTPRRTRWRGSGTACTGGIPRKWAGRKPPVVSRVIPGIRCGPPAIRARRCIPRNWWRPAARATKINGMGMRKGVHHAAGEKNEFGRGLPLDCLKCHGQDVHGMPPVRDVASPVNLDNQVAVCGKCHEKYLATYEASVHGHGLRESGLTVTAVCSDCHRAHDILYAADRRSSLHTTNVAATCGKCHAFIQERLAHSVHGQGTGAGGVSERPSPGGKTLRHPSCVDCHQGHDLPHPESARVPPPDSQSVRQLPRRLRSALRRQRPRPVDRTGLRACQQVLRLPRRPRHSAAHQPGLADQCRSAAWRPASGVTRYATLSFRPL